MARHPSISSDIEEYSLDLLFPIPQVDKVHIFWEGHTILPNLHLTFVLVVPVKSKVKILQNFVAFSEYMDFKLQLTYAEIDSSNDVLKMNGLYDMQKRKKKIILKSMRWDNCVKCGRSARRL